MRRTKRRTSAKIHFQEFWDSCAQNKTSEISKMWLESWDSRAQNNASEISKSALSEILGPVRRTERRNFKHHLQKFGDSCAQDTSEVSKNVSFVLALNKAHVLALNTAHVLCLNKV